LFDPASLYSAIFKAEIFKLTITALLRNLSSRWKFNIFREYQLFWGQKRFPWMPQPFFGSLPLAPGISPTQTNPFRYPDQIDNFCPFDDNCRGWQDNNAWGLGPNPI
jgi:hypothetical protein